MLQNNYSVTILIITSNKMALFPITRKFQKKAALQ